MDKKIAAHVKINLKKIEAGAPHPFFFCEEADLLYVTGKAGPFSVVSTIVKVNSRLKRIFKGATPVEAGVGFCVGEVFFHEKTFYFHVLQRKGISDDLLGKGLKRLRKSLGVRCRVGRPELLGAEVSPELVAVLQGRMRLPPEPQMEDISALVETWQGCIRRMRGEGLTVMLQQVLAPEGELTREVALSEVILLDTLFAEDSAVEVPEMLVGLLRERQELLLGILLPEEDAETHAATLERLLDTLAMVETWRHVEQVDTTMTAFVQKQVEQKRLVSDGDTVGAVDNQKKCRLLQQKEAALQRQLLRAKLISAWLSESDLPENPMLARELADLTGEILMGRDVVGGELGIRSQIGKIKEALAAHRNRYPAYYMHNEKLAGVPIDTIQRRLDELELVTTCSSPPLLMAGLREALGHPGVGVTCTGEGDNIQIEIGRGLVVSASMLGDAGTKRILMMMKNMAATDAGNKLLVTLARSKRMVTIEPADAVDGSPFYSSPDPMKRNMKRRREPLQKMGKRHLLAHRLQSKAERLSRDPALAGLERLREALADVHEEQGMLDTPDAVRELNSREEDGWSKAMAVLHEKKKAAEDEIQKFLAANSHLPQLEQELADAQTQLTLLNEHWSKSLLKRGATVCMRLGDPGLKIRERFNYAGMSAPLPEDLILFHELTHALHDVEGTSRVHLAAERWLNEEEHWTVLAEIEYAEQIGLRWKRVQYDASLSPIDTRMPETLPPEKLEQLQERFRKKRAQS